MELRKIFTQNTYIKGNFVPQVMKLNNDKETHTCFFVEHFMGGPAAFETLLKTYKNSSCHTSNIKTTRNQLFLLCRNKQHIINLHNELNHLWCSIKAFPICRINKAAFIKRHIHLQTSNAIQWQHHHDDDVTLQSLNNNDSRSCLASKNLVSWLPIQIKKWCNVSGQHRVLRQPQQI